MVGISERSSFAQNKDLKRQTLDHRLRSLEGGLSVIKDFATVTSTSRPISGRPFLHKAARLDAIPQVDSSTTGRCLPRQLDQIFDDRLDITWLASQFVG